MKIDVEDIVKRLESLESALPQADALNGRLMRDSDNLREQLRADVKGLTAEVRQLRTEVSFLTTEQKDIRAMLRRNFELDVEAGIAEAIAREKRDRANAAVEQEP